jgi:hypothetical protein
VKRLTLISVLAAGILLFFAPEAARASDLYNNTNGGGVSNGPTGKTAFGLTCNAHITQLVTYHWNNGRGATPGTISIQSNQTGKIYGPFAAHGSSGQNNAPNVNWIADVSFDLPGGKGLTGLATYSYVVIDSNNATWSMDPQSAYRGFAIIRGDCTTSAATAPPTPPVRGGGPPVPIVKTVPTPPKATPPPIKMIVRAIPTKTPIKPTPTSAKQTPPALPKKPTPAPATLNPLAAIKPCFTNSGALANVGPCFGIPGSMLAVRVLSTARGPFVGLQFRTVVTAGVPALVDAPLTGSGSILGATVSTRLCLAPAPTKWDVWLLGGSAARPTTLGVIGQFSVTGCQNVTTSKGIPTPQPGTPPPGLANVKPCFVNTGALASVGPCFGPANSKLAVRIYNQQYGPYTLLQFQIAVTGGVPALVTTPLVGSGPLVSANVPIQLCLAKSPAKWQVWLFNQTKSVGQIGQFTITGCP